MKRIFVFGFLMALILVGYGQAYARSDYAYATKDPQHKGYFTYDDDLYRIKWTDMKNTCEPCKPLVESYNKAVPALFDLKYQRAKLKDSVGHLQRAIKDLKNQKIKAAEEANEVVDSIGRDADGRSAALSRIMALEDMKELIKSLDAQIISTQNAIADLWAQIQECNKQCGEDAEEPIGSLGGNPPQLPPLPFDWKGPYPAVCQQCEKLAFRLNSLPGLAIKEQGDLAAATAMKASFEAEMNAIRLKDDDIVFTKGARYYVDGAWRSGEAIRKHLQDMDMKWDEYKIEKIKKLEEKIEKVDEDIKRIEKNIEKIKKNFKETLKLYNDCVPTCKKKQPPKEPEEKTSLLIPGAEGTGVPCSFPASYPSITIGPNDKVGTGAQLRKDIKNKAKGMAMGALGSALGGGIGFGGGGAGDIEEGPKTDKDPTSGKFFDLSNGDTDLEVRAGFTDEGLVISTNIDDTPGNGTFHALWIEGADGKVYFPRRYLLIDLYRNWKLSVWWTYDRWVNGDHVEHREGDSLTVGTDYLGTFKFLEGMEGVGKSIWYLMGFETAVKGVKHLGAVFDLPPAALSGPCSLRVVIHISQPKADPVHTIPVVGELFREGDKDDDRELQILVRPAIIENEE